VTHTLLRPAATGPSAPFPARFLSSIVPARLSKAGSIRPSLICTTWFPFTYEFCPVLANQIPPAPAARPVGSTLIGINRTTRRVSGSMRETVPSSRFATQTEPNPETISAGRAPTATSSVTRFVFGSMTATEFGATSAAAEPELPWPSAKTGIATAAAATPISAAPAYIRRRLRLSSTSTVRSGLNSLGSPSIMSWYSRWRWSSSFSRRSPRSRIETPDGRSSSASSFVVDESSTWPPWPAAPILAARCTPIPTYRSPPTFGSPVCNPIRTLT
jgi:hypothetical protein